MTKFIIIVGKSCTGKDTFIKQLKQKYTNIHEMKNSTTRPKRNEDEDTYHFLTKEEMLQELYNDNMIECYIYNNLCYGLCKSEIALDKINITSLSIERANLFYDYVKANNLLENCLVVFMHASESIRLERYFNRLKLNNSLTLEEMSELVRRFRTEEIDYSTTYLEDYNNIIHLNTDNNTINNDAISIIDKFIQGD